MTEPSMSLGNVRMIIAELTQAIENAENGMGKGLTEECRVQGDLIRHGKIRAYNYAISRIKSMADWMGMEL